MKMVLNADVNAQVFAIELQEFVNRNLDEKYSILVEGMLPHKVLVAHGQQAADDFFTLQRRVLWY